MPNSSENARVNADTLRTGTTAAPDSAGSASVVSAAWRTFRNSSFIRNVFETYATHLFLLAISLTMNIAVARALGPSGSGLYAVAAAISVIGSQFGNLGLHRSNTYYLAKDRTLLGTLIANTLLISFGAGGAMAAFGQLVFTVFPQLAPLDRTLLLIAFLRIPFGLALLLLENLLLGLEEVRSYNKVEMLNRLIAFSLTILVVVSGRATPTIVFAATLFGVAVAIVFALRLLKRGTDLSAHPSMKLLRLQLKLGLRAYVIALFSFLLLRIDLVMVKYLAGAEQAGYYSIASTMADYILILPATVGLILFPRLLTIASSEDRFARTRKVAFYTGLALLPVLLIGTVAAKLLVRLLFGSVFLPAVEAFIWLAPGILALGVEIAIVQFLNSEGYPAVVIWIWSSCTALNVLLNFWAIPHLGIRGASMVSSLCYTLVLTAILIVIKTRAHAVANQTWLAGYTRAGDT